MATTKKPAAPAAVKEVPAASPKPAPKSVVAKKVAPVAAAAVKTVLVKVAPKAAAKAVATPVATPVAEKALPPVVEPVAKPAVKAAAKKKAKPVSVHLDSAQRAKHIEVAAFYIAERRGFTPGNPEQDYLDAASEIDSLIAVGHFGK